MKNNTSLMLILVGCFVANNSCSEADLPAYGIQEQAINFWVAPTRSNPNPVYPRDLNDSYDFGLFANFLARGYEAFSDFHTLQLSVQTQGYPITDDRKVFFLADSIKLGTGLNTIFDDEYVFKSGETTAVFAYSAKAIPTGRTTTVVFTFDYSKTEFLKGVIERQYYTLACTNTTGQLGGIPANIAGFNPSALWNNFYFSAFGAQSYTKFKFLSLIYGKSDFSALPLAGTAAAVDLVNQLNTALAEYKDLNAQNPVKYPPLYYESTSTWISFP